MQKGHFRGRNLLGSIAFAVGIIILWQFLYVLSTQWLEVAKPYAVPHPLGVVETIQRLFSDGTLLSAIISSMLRVLAGFGISVVIGVLLGVLILQSRYLERNLKPLILGIQTLPSICWVPFAILWFGLGESAIIFVVVMGAAFSIAISVESSVRNIPPIYVKAARTMGLSNPFELYRRVIFSAALPALVSGLKQGWSFAWRALMSGEVMSATAGLGYTLMVGRDLADINQVMTIILVIIFLGILIDKGVFGQIEKRILKKRGLQ